MTETQTTLDIDEGSHEMIPVREVKKALGLKTNKEVIRLARRANLTVMRRRGTDWMPKRDLRTLIGDGKAGL